MKENRSEDSKGFALVITLLILLVLTFIGISAVNTSIFETSITRNDRLRADAFYASEAGNQVAVDNLPNTDPISPAKIGENSYYWTGSATDRGSPKKIQWVGNCPKPGFDSTWIFKRFQVNTTGESFGATREIEVQVMHGPLTLTTSYNN
jgi:hypothetical protein